MFLGRYTIAAGEMDVNNIAYLVLSYDLEVMGETDMKNAMAINRVINGTESAFVVDTIDNFS